LLVDLAAVVENDLISVIVLSADYCQDDGTRILHVFLDQIQYQLLVGFRLRFVGRMDEARKIDKGSGHHLAYI
jgi:hypothetical protein